MGQQSFDKARKDFCDRYHEIKWSCHRILWIMRNDFCSRILTREIWKCTKQRWLNVWTGQGKKRLELHVSFSRASEKADLKGMVAWCICQKKAALSCANQALWKQSYGLVLTREWAGERRSSRVDKNYTLGRCTPPNLHCHPRVKPLAC